MREHCRIVGKRAGSALETCLGAGIIALFALGGVAAAAAEKPLWLVVGRSYLTPPLAPLAEKRRSEGFDVVVSTRPVDEALAAAKRHPDFLLLVGDDQPGKEDAPWYLPAKRKPLYRWRRFSPSSLRLTPPGATQMATVFPTYRWGGSPPARQAKSTWWCAKYWPLRPKSPTAADLQAPVWFGSPEYNGPINSLASGFGVALIQSEAPNWLCPWIVSGSTGDAFCGWPPDQAARFSRQVHRGGIVSILMGHASADAFYSMRFQAASIWYSAADAAREMAQGPPAPPMVFFACNSGNFARPTACQAKAMLFLPGGPVATFGATDRIASVDELLFQRLPAPRFRRAGAETGINLAACPTAGKAYPQPADGDGAPRR